MSKTIKYWLNSGANAFSCYKGTVTTDQLGITVDEWDAMSETEKEEIMKEYAFEKADWGFAEDDE